jgi:obg-like ATPase 1
MGIVGLPNVGKSTTFNLLSNLQVPSSNFMFCTIDPNKARIEVPDHRYEKLVEIYKPKSKVAATLSILDIAGLVKGASQGNGMGNEFLSHIQSVDGIFHVVRAFDDDDIQHYEGEVDPVRDLEIIQGELMEKDRVFLTKNLEDLEKAVNKANPNPANLKEAKEERDVLKRVCEMYEKGLNVRDGTWHYKEIDILNKHLFFTAKSTVYLVNMSEKDYASKKNKYLAKIKKWIDTHGGGTLIPYSAAFEQKIAAMSPEERVKFTTETGATSALPKIANAGYAALNLIHFFTCGEDEVKCWTIRNGEKAPQAAGVIHTDFERGFISAEVMKYDDLVALGCDENNVKKEGKVRVEGKNYVVCDGDIIYFKFNVSDPGAKKKK